ncbi:MAG: YHS domain-containing protein [Rhizobiales bacterium]|nr:YHS domain-containing protein [Hyphomicrobiales bacterium]MBI3672074.1 YHS domain-containing protein [Hyphomicrobiales bacterium]
MGAPIYFLLFAGLFAVMMRFGCGAHMLGHRHGKPGSADQARLVPPGKDKDPVCGMIVETTTAETSVHAGRLYRFCSTNCRDRFEASPASYVTSTNSAQTVKEDCHAPQ